jgi:hypothetical protein
MGAKRTAKKGTARALSPDELAARIAATGLASTAYLLPWESIHGPGDYVAIARAMRGLAGTAFPLERESDTVDLAGEQASLELALSGVHHVLEAEVSGPRVDDGILVMLAALFDLRQAREPAETRRGFFVDATTCKAAKTHLLLCVTREAALAVNGAAGAAFVPLAQL